MTCLSPSGATRSKGWTLLVLAVLGVASCSRTPPEPPQALSAPVTAASAPGAPAAAPSSASASTSHAPARCILPTPATPPPAVTAASKDACPKDPGPVPHLSNVSVAFPEADGAKDGGAQVKVDAELARTAADSERGLMYRTLMAEDHGMLFDLGDRREHVFWMRNTCLPLDMMFVDDDGTIVGVLENVPTLNDEERTVGCFSSWVLEVNAGWSRRHGVRAGQHLTLPRH